MIRPCTQDDLPIINAIINDGAEAYRGVIPADCWHDPYMTLEHLGEEVAKGVEFSAWEENGTLCGVMGLQRVRDVTLIRHAYVRTVHQGHGVGGELIKDVLSRTTTPVLLGAWAAATWAHRFYERHGFRLVATAEKDRLLQTYWNLPARQRETSVVLTRGTAEH